MIDADATRSLARQRLTWLPIPVTVLVAGLLLHGAATIWDLMHVGDIFHGGTSQNGAIAYLLGTGFAYLRLVMTAVLVPGLWVASRRAPRAGSRSPGVVGPLSAFLAVCGGTGIVVTANDSSDPRRLGLVHGNDAPVWIAFADAVTPYAVVVGATGAVLLVLLAFVAWWREQ